ncbi:type II toxin-antitoxin system CcdA family antitoxin [Pseudooceanicola sp. HF7]|uniref:type II toxin-antitoxin system CcdA family antitoxin n=1 Tax=Pseudooceanicola sp. HF7 TaxID=2721560 RepID=UPI0020CA7EBF|nr:type II toxin-antitoxin system CcdA family antitoxin [Pseudooceanicola sp. HF7]
MTTMTPTTRSAEKQRTNITVDARTLTQARALNLNVSAISEAALARAVREAAAESWAAENAAALRERRDWIAANGTPLAAYQVLKTD